MTEPAPTFPRILCCIATVTRHGITRQVPTFYLDSWNAGILTLDHAERVAAAVVNPWNDDAVRVSVTVAGVDSVPAY